MDKVNSAGRFLVVTPNIVVGTDLKEALVEYAGGHVDVHAKMDETWGTDYSLAVFGVALDEVLNDPRVRMLHNHGAHVIVLNGNFPHSVLDGTGIVALPQPFVTADLTALLQKSGLLLQGKT